MKIWEGNICHFSCYIYELKAHFNDFLVSNVLILIFKSNIYSNVAGPQGKGTDAGEWNVAGGKNWCRDIIIILYTSIEPSIGKCPRGGGEMSQGKRSDVGK